MKNGELAKEAGRLLDWMDENLTCDASEKIAILKSSATIIENQLSAESLRIMLHKMLKDRT